MVSQCVGSGCGLVRARLLPIALTAPGADQEGLVGVPVIFAEFLACDTHCAFGQHRARLDTTRTAVDVGQVGQHWAKHPVAADLGHRERFLQQAARFIRVALREARQRQAGQRVGQVVKVLAAVILDLKGWLNHSPISLMFWAALLHTPWRSFADRQIMLPEHTRSEHSDPPG